MTTRLDKIASGFRLFGCGLIAMTMIGMLCDDSDAANVDGLPTDAVFSISKSACEWENCAPTNYSMTVASDGTYDLYGLEACASPVPCRDKLAADEVRKLFGRIDAFDFKSKATASKKCKLSSPDTIIRMHLASGNKEYELIDNTACTGAANKESLKQFESDIDSILDIDRRGVQSAAILDLADCKPTKDSKKFAEKDAEGVVGLRLNVDATGRLASTSVVKSSGYPGLDKDTVEAIGKCLFKAGKKYGRPVASSFRLDHVWHDDD